MMNVFSMDLLEEMKTIVRENGFIGAPGRAKDDRVIAAALACVAFAEQVQPRLIAAKLTREVSAMKEMRSAESYPQPPTSATT
jgi:hypothetical protein